MSQGLEKMPLPGILSEGLGKASGCEEEALAVAALMCL